MILFRPRTCLYSVNDEGPNIRSRWGRCSVGFVLLGSEYIYHGNEKEINKAHEKRLTPYNSSLQPAQSPAPPKSDRLTFRSSKNVRARSQSYSVGSRIPMLSMSVYIVSMSSLRAFRCRWGRGRRDLARSIPRELRRNPRCPCSVVFRRRKTHRPCCPSLVKDLDKK